MINSTNMVEFLTALAGILGTIAVIVKSAVEIAKKLPVLMEIVKNSSAYKFLLKVVVYLLFFLTLAVPSGISIKWRKTRARFLNRPFSCSSFFKSPCSSPSTPLPGVYGSYPLCAGFRKIKKPQKDKPMNPRIFIPALFLGALLFSACLPSETEVTITQPSEGARVEQSVSVDGESQLLPEDSVIWLAVYLPITGMYYPQNFPADVQANGEWSGTVYIGQEGEHGLAADIIVVVAEKEAQAAFESYLSEARDKNDFSGLERLAEGAVIYDRVSVTRK